MNPNPQQIEPNSMQNREALMQSLKNSLALIPTATADGQSKVDVIQKQIDELTNSSEYQLDQIVINKVYPAIRNAQKAMKLVKSNIMEMIPGLPNAVNLPDTVKPVEVDIQKVFASLSDEEKKIALAAVKDKQAFVNFWNKIKSFNYLKWGSLTIPVIVGVLLFLNHIDISIVLLSIFTTISLFKSSIKKVS